jgi:hypothetical protein
MMEVGRLKLTREFRGNLEGKIHHKQGDFKHGFYRRVSGGFFSQEPAGINRCLEALVREYQGLVGDTPRN